MTATPLSALMSEALVAFTIEFDNESERRLPHRTTDYGPAGKGLVKPWLASMVMWFNCMQHVGDDGLTVKELEAAARTKTNLNGMERWGYIIVTRDGRQQRVRATAAGRMAQDIWRPLFAEIEERWTKRFNRAPVQALRDALHALVAQFDVDLPDCLPVLGYGLTTRSKDDDRRPPARRPIDAANIPLPSLLSRALMAFALEFERSSDLSLAIHADVLRVVTGEGVPLRDLPRLGGVSKEAVAIALKILAKSKLAIVAPDPRFKRAKLVTLTARGRAAQSRYRTRVDAIEAAWGERFGARTIHALRQALEAFVRPEAARSPLFDGLTPDPGGWRARIPAPAVLPHFPMILHRGGYPDGS